MILPLEKQVCALKYSKRFKELGVKQESLWWWDLRRKKEDCDIGDKPKDEWILSYEECYQGDRDDLISAFTTSELGKMLPDIILIGNKIYVLEIYHKRGVRWFINYVWYKCKPKDYMKKYLLKRVTANTEANARAKMLIYLIENKLIEVNK